MRRKCHTCLCRTCLNACKCEGCTGKKESCERYSGFRQLSIFEQEIKQHMKVLVACEESQRVCIEFRKLGHEAYSCDIEECSGGHPEWHIQGDALSLLNGKCVFCTMDGETHTIGGKWDLIIAHQPCTYLSNCGAARLYPKKGVLNQERFEKGLKAKDFFMQFYNADCEKIAIENPIPTRVYELPKYDQIIQPYEYGHPYSKKTCLWLKGLPTLQPTEIVTENIISWVSGGSKRPDGTKRKQSGTKFRDAKTRSKTFEGIAKAMAEQWGKADELSEPQCHSVPRHSWQYYGITKERYRQLTEYIQSGRYASLALQVAHRTDNDIAEFILLSVTKTLSFEGLEKLYGRGEIERIPCSRTVFYYTKKYFYHLFDLEVRRIGK